MAAKKQISTSSSDDDDSSFERFVEQHTPSLKRKQPDNEEEEEEEEESESEDSSSDEDENEQEDEEEAKSPATKSVSHPSQVQQCTKEEKEVAVTYSPTKVSVPHPSEQSFEAEEKEKEDKEDHKEEENAKSPVQKSESEDSSNEDENEEENEEEAKSPATKSVSHPSQARQCTKEVKKKSVPHPSDQSSEEKEKEKEEDEENAKSPVENSESLQPQKKKSKPNLVLGPSPSTTTNAVQRIWSLEDELVLLRALSHYHNTFNQVPSPKEYESFLSNIIESLSFPATENQLHNKIRTWKTNYGQRKKMSSKAKSLNSHENVVFKTCAKLFEDTGKTKSVGRVANSTSGDGAMARCSIYLRELISRQKLPTLLSTVEDVVQKLGESRARDLAAKAKQLSIDAMKLHAREEKLMADLFDVVADKMAGDS